MKQQDGKQEFVSNTNVVTEIILFLITASKILYDKTALVSWLEGSVTFQVPLYLLATHLSHLCPW